jgi:hypothetical protein
MIKDFTFRRYWLPFVLSLLIGLFISWIDSGAKWDDTGITALAIFLSTLALGAFRLKGAWLWALLVGGTVFMINVLRNHNYQSFLALVISFVGAYAGVGVSLLKKRVEKTDH